MSSWLLCANQRTDGSLAAYVHFTGWLDVCLDPPTCSTTNGITSVTSVWTPFLTNGNFTWFGDLPTSRVTVPVTGRTNVEIRSGCSTTFLGGGSSWGACFRMQGAALDATFTPKTSFETW